MHLCSLCCGFRAAEIILVDYQGNLYCYLVSPTDGYQQSHVFSFAQHYRQGVLSVSYHPSHNMLFVAGPSSVKNADSLKVLTLLNLVQKWIVNCVLSL